jgi:regulator of sirC expression with transglutaminase-like and TPR domain
MGAMRKSRLLALITLLDDPDPLIFEAVEKELQKESIRIIPELEIVWETTLCDVCQERIGRLMRKIRLKEETRKLKSWSAKKDPDLLEGFIIISRYLFPEISTEKVSRKIEEIRRRIWVELNNSLTSLEKITVLNHVVFNEYRFRIVADNQENMKSHSVAHLLESGSGSVVAFALLYQIIAARLDLPVRFIDFPRHPLLAYADKKIAVRVHPPEVETDILFYINPAGKGSISGRRELEFVLRKMNPVVEISTLETGSPATFLLRLLESIDQSAALDGETDRKNEIQLMTEALGVKKKTRSTPQK